MRDAATSERTVAEKFAGWRMIVLASFIHNCSYGAIFGTYGVSVLAIQERFGVSRALAASLLSLMMAAMILSAPLLGALYGKVSIRRSMLLGTVLAAVGHFIPAFSTDWRVMVASYALLIGPGVALTSSMPTNVLVTNWFATNQGRAFGVVNLPIGMVVMPMVAAQILQTQGLAYLYVVSGITLLLIVPAAWAVVDRPADVGQMPHGAMPTTGPRADSAPSDLSALTLLRRVEFWVITVAIGVIVGGAAMKQAHLVPLLAEQGHSLDLASRLLALSSAAGAVGSLAVGWLADRFGGLAVLLGNAILQAMMWFVFLLPVSVPLLTLDALVIGACGGGVAAAQGVLISRSFGSRSFGKALGLVGICAAPFLLGINTVAGLLHDRTGSYRLAVYGLIVATIVAALTLALVSRGTVPAARG